MAASTAERMLVTTKMSTDKVSKIDALADKQGVSRAEWVRRLIDRSLTRAK
jgi:hypothetical protein